MAVVVVSVVVVVVVDIVTVAVVGLGCTSETRLEQDSLVEVC